MINDLEAETFGNCAGRDYSSRHYFVPGILLTVQYRLSMLLGRRTVFYLTLTVLLLFVKTLSSSDGDERPTFLKCLETCPKDCELSWILKWTGWNCADDCKYRCMRMDVELIRKNGKVDKTRTRTSLYSDDKTGGYKPGRIVQYYGKWPFVRVLGAQEIFSVLFSLGNLFACLYGYSRIYRRNRNRKSHQNHGKKLAYMGNVHWVGLLVTCNAWIQSAIFHYRDTPFTEKLDYFSACLLILSTVPSALIRIFEIKTFTTALKRKFKALAVINPTDPNLFIIPTAKAQYPIDEIKEILRCHAILSPSMTALTKDSKKPDTPAVATKKQ